MGIQIKIGDETQGPFEEAEIRAMVASGSVGLADLALADDKKKWIPLRELMPDLEASPEGSGGVLARLARQLVSQLRADLGGNFHIEGITLMRVGAGLFVAVLLMQLLVLFYFLGFLPWHAVGLVAQGAIVIPLFFRGKTSRFPLALTAGLIVIVLGDAGLLGIQSAGAYLGDGATASRKAIDRATPPRILALEREKAELENQRYSMQERLEMGLRAARLKVAGKDKQAKKIETDIYALRDRLSEEEMDQLNARINLVNAKLTHRRWQDRHDVESLRQIVASRVLLYIGIGLAVCGAWAVRAEPG